MSKRRKEVKLQRTKIEDSPPLVEANPDYKGCEKILIVDDDKLIRTIFRDLLKPYGYRIIEALNSKDALKVVVESPPDIILLDIIMPGMDGMGLCRTLKNREDTQEIPIIIVSSKGNKKTIVEALEIGADDYLVKPIEETELLARIHTQLRNRRQYLELEEDKRDLEITLDIARALSSTLSAKDIMYIIVSKVAEITSADRCSIILIDEENDLGYILASHEDPNIHDVKIDLKRYPEIKQVIELKKAVVIDDLLSNPLMKEVRFLIKNYKDVSVLVVPIVWNDEVLGTLFLRARRSSKRFTQKEVNFCQVVANASFHAMRNAQLFSTVLREKDHLKVLSITDQLTNVFNHSYFYARLEEEYQRAMRYKLHLSCIMLDIDNFKRINDTYGHRRGDDVLSEIAQTIKTTVRKSDLVARYGGEEFSIILPHTDLKGGMREAERVRKAVEGLTFTGLPKEDHLTISSGVATFPEEGIDNSHDLITHADKALYEAKKKGKNVSLAYPSI